MRPVIILGLSSALLLAAVAPAVAKTQPAPVPEEAKSHFEVVRDVARMVNQRTARRAVRRVGMRLLNVLWEDTGRYYGSSVGPNISDVTIEVETENKRGRKVRRLMPVMRYPNFRDKTGDIDIDEFMIRVGNHREGDEVHSVSLRQFLQQPAAYMSQPEKGKIRNGSLLAKRDEVVLVSAQAAFLPIRRDGSTKFWPVIFNYQSYARNPAVLTILVTRQGTSMTVIDNERDTVGTWDSWGQRLYFNHHGQRAPLTAERMNDVVERGFTMNGEDARTLKDDANMLMLIQVPLRQRPMRATKSSAMMGVGGAAYGAAGVGQAAPTAPAKDDGGFASGKTSDVDRAVIGRGPTEGPFTELDGLRIRRDPRFPIRVTVQFYQATSNGVVNSDDIDRLSGKIARVYDQAEYVGSLVVPDGARRRTMWSGATAAPKWLTWADFPGLAARVDRFGVLGLRSLQPRLRQVIGLTPETVAMVRPLERASVRVAKDLVSTIESLQSVL